VFLDRQQVAEPSGEAETLLGLPEGQCVSGGYFCDLFSHLGGDVLPEYDVIQGAFRCCNHGLLLVVVLEVLPEPWVCHVHRLQGLLAEKAVVYDDYCFSLIDQGHAL